ncbi:MAG: glycosyltransferase family 4 protein [Bacteroidetes bacterium]|nr:glycosyltransferase family 4 protein [Bacteroidota bacterium]
MSELSPIRTLQIGKSWLPEQSGSGLDRMFYGLVHSLPAQAVSVKGLVAGSASVLRDSEGAVTSFASDKASLLSRWLGARSHVRAELTDNPPNLAAIHFAVYAFPAIGYLRQLPRVVHFHGPWALESQVEGKSRVNVAFKKYVETAVYSGADRFIVLSRAFADVLREHYDVPDESIRVVPGGVDTQRFSTSISKTEARTHLGWPTDRPIVLSVRRLARRMGLENLVDAASQVSRTHPEVLFLLAGKGPIEHELRQRVEAAGLADNVRLLGFVADDDLPMAYRAATLTVAPTVSLEGFGLVTIESLASGTPVLVTPVGGLPEVVTDLSENLVTAGPESSDLADGIRSILSGGRQVPDDARCRAYAVNRFDWNSVAAMTRSVYEEVL